MNLDFQAMPLSELRAYVLANRHDEAAFFCLADRLEANPSQIYPPPDTPENIQIVEAVIKQQLAR